MNSQVHKARRRGASSTKRSIVKKRRVGNVLLVFTLWAGVIATTGLAYNNLKHYISLDVQSVAINSAFNYASRDQVSSVIEPMLNTSFFTLDLGAIKTKLESLDWIYRAEVRRQWPNGLVINVQEQRPIARWGDSSFVSVDGDVFSGNGVLVSAKLPRLHGPPGTEKRLMNYFLEFNRMLKRNGLALGELVFDEKHTLSAKLSNGLPIYFGSERLVEKMQRFLAVHSHALAGRDKQLNYVDLRYSNGMAVHWQNSGEKNERQIANKKSARSPRAKAFNG
ncbi:MAG: cell division protein FtsQ/DivIB [Pseudomonadales bacterium]